ncbi:MAG: caspase family protein [Pseudomonadota bacterium]
MTIDHRRPAGVVPAFCARRLVVGAAALLMATAVLAAAPAEAANRALVIGINDYPNLEDGALRSPAADATKFRSFLVEQGWFEEDEISLLLNGDATGAAIRQAIAERLIAETAPGDRVLFYFSGHGTRIEDRDGDEPDGYDEVLIATDAADGLPDGLLVDDELRELFDRLEERDVMVVVDACHSGTATRAPEEDESPEIRKRSVVVLPPGFRGVSRQPRPAEPEALGEPPLAADAEARSVWAAAAPAQLAWEDRDGGVFTRLFMEGLAEGVADANGNGQVTSAELLDYVRERTEEWCRKAGPCKAHGLGFTPHLEGPADRVMADVAAQPADDATDPSAAPAGDGAPTTDSSTPPPATSQTPVAEEADLPALPNAVLASDLLGHRNPAGLQLRMLPGATVPVGDEVQFVAAADRPGMLLVLDVNPAGAIYQLSPSRLSRPGVGRVPAGVEVVIPEAVGASGAPLRIRAVEPSGRGQLVAILVEDPSFDLDAVLGAHLALRPVPNATAYLAAIAELLRRMTVDNGVNRAINWSVAYLDYEIVPG